MNRFALLSGAILMAALTNPAWAQSADAPKPVTPATVPAERAAGGHEKVNFLDSYDINGDVSVTSDEFNTQRATDYKRIDADANGAVIEAEYVSEFAVRLDRQLQAQREGQIKQAHVRFGVLDKNKDGHISAEEFTASGTRMFSALDANKDGVVDEKDKAEKY